jgi:hypothetical protein
MPRHHTHAANDEVVVVDLVRDGVVPGVDDR